VRDFFIHNALYWLEEYHLDGLRLDAVHAIATIRAQHILDRARRARAHAAPARERQVHLVLENDANEARYLGAGATPRAVERRHPPRAARAGGTASRRLLRRLCRRSRGRARALPGRGLRLPGRALALSRRAARGEPSATCRRTAFVSFLQNHDQVGNRAFGERIGAARAPRQPCARRPRSAARARGPLLFMGEEFAATTPFLFFCDFGGELRDAVTEGRRREFALSLESGEERSGEFRPCELESLERQEGEIPRMRVAFDWHDRLPIGYHTYALRGPALPEDAAVTFIVAPERCFLPPALRGGGRVWGPALQLYSVRSQRNWGMGDYTDLRSVIEQWGYRGAGIVGVNPLHALYPHNPAHASPYSPSSRLFLNVLYIDVEAMTDAHECADALTLMGSAQFQSALRRARTSEFVDYGAVAALKLPLLERLHRHFREHHLAEQSTRGRAFRDFLAEGGMRLRQHALFETLQEHFHREDPAVWGWPVWPAAYRHPDSDAVTRFAEAHAERIEFFQYLQWEAALQLERACSRARSMELSVGLYQDLAISIDSGGAESWANQGLYAVGASIGAPPDEINLQGQNWGLPPVRPERLRDARYEPFIATLRANMRCAGALRIDHVMGLARLYWIPPGATPAEGAYVCYPFDDLLAILALESERNRCMVIGEDLGTVPAEVRAQLMRTGVLSYRLLYFEKAPDGEFKAPAEYPVDALVAASTHDLPTLTGFWSGHDLELRQRLGLFPSDEVRTRYVVERVQDRARLALALEREKLLPEAQSANPVAASMTPEFALAIHAFLAHTPSRLFVVQLEDVLGVYEQANLPGTTHEQPNWRRKLPLPLDELDQDPRLRTLTELLSRIRPVPVPVRRTAGAPGARIPRCTYRLQLHRGFTFADATALVPYLDRLGVSHVYCSPYLRARPGSTHGYDIIDHNALNPEIGSREDLEHFVAALREHGMGHILDVVPNHMGVMGADNAWWLDVLENGPASAYAEFFDIDWHPANAALENKVLIPVLGDQYGIVLERGELLLRFRSETGELSVHYFDHRFPVNPRTYPAVLEAAAGLLHPGELPPGAAAELASLCASFGHLPLRVDARPESRNERQRDKDVHKQQLARLVRDYPSLSRAIEHAVVRLNGTAGDPASFQAMHELLERQCYRLSSWRVAADEINYRRFFDINDLAPAHGERGGVRGDAPLRAEPRGRRQDRRAAHRPPRRPLRSGAVLPQAAAALRATRRRGARAWRGSAPGASPLRRHRENRSRP
jgi:(1->4)-alpha-D-glucan 1-alpha-D-glucosylmutase